MPGQIITVKAAGLHIQPNDLGEVPDGALAQADNIQISRDGVIEPRRGWDIATTSVALRKLFEYGFTFDGYPVFIGVGRSSNTAFWNLYYSNTGVGNWTQIPGMVTVPTTWIYQKLRAQYANGVIPLPFFGYGFNAYFSGIYSNKAGVFCMESASSTPRPAGMPQAVDCYPVLDTNGTAVPGNSQVAYRSVFGYRDSNGNLHLSAPSQRGTLVNTALTVAAGSVSRTSTTVTVTVTNTLSASDIVYLEDGDGNFPPGAKTVATASGSSFTYTESGSAVSSSVQFIYANPTKNAKVSVYVPPGMPDGTFIQLYRSRPSVAETVPPDDELALVYESAIPTSESGLYMTQAARSTNVITVTTNKAHGLRVGDQVRMARAISTNEGTLFMVCASNSTQGYTSTDGTTWNSITMPSAACEGLIWDGVNFVTWAGNAIWRSTDGSSWTAGTNRVSYVKGPVYTNGLVGSLYYGGANASSEYGYYTSSDSGATWGAFVKTQYPDGGGWAYPWIPYPWRGYGTALNVGAIEWQGSPSGLPKPTGWPEQSLPLQYWQSGQRTFGPYGLPTANFYNFPSPMHESFTSFSETTGPQQRMQFDGYYLYVLVQDNENKWWVARAPWHDTQNWDPAYLPIGTTTMPEIAYNPFSGVLHVQRQDSPYTISNIVGSATYPYKSWCPAAQKLLGIRGGNTTQYIKIATDSTISEGTLPGNAAFAASNWTGNILGALVTVASTPTSVTFTYSSTGSDFTAKKNYQKIYLEVANLGDVVPEGLTGAYLYTNPSQGGILQANQQPPVARDMALFRGYAFYSSPTPRIVRDFALVMTGTGGLVADDTLTINGSSVLTAKATEDASASQFKVYTSGLTPGVNLQLTAESIMRVANRLGYMIVANERQGIPGMMSLVGGMNSTSISVASSRPSAFVGLGTSYLKERPNWLAYSKANEPESVPFTNVAEVGESDSSILRIVPTRNSLLIFKEDGIYQLTGYGPPWQIDPFDLTMEVVGPHTVVPLDNQVYAFTHHGVARVSDSGSQIISRPIEPPLLSLLSNYRPQVKQSAFGVADEGDHKYYLWVPEDGAGTQASACYTYDLFTDTWLRRTDSHSFGHVHSGDDKMYLVNGYDTSAAKVCSERKTITTMDFMDAAAVASSCTVSSGSGAVYVITGSSGAAVGDVFWQSNAKWGVVTNVNGTSMTFDRSPGFTTSAACSHFKPISAVIQWSPRFGQNPAAMNHFREAGIHFRSVYFSTASIGFSTDLSPSWTDITIPGSSYGLSTAGTGYLGLRTLVPMEKQRGKVLHMRFQHAQAACQMQIQALSLAFNVGPVRFGR